MSYSTCAWCPRLCRHVCPVAVATGREAATPTAMMAVPLLAAQIDDPGFGVAGTSLCLGCGACSAHCKWHVPVAEHLHAWRRDQKVVVRAEVLAPIVGDAPRVALLTGARDWSTAWTARRGERLATMRSGDELGFAAWKAGDSTVLPRVMAHFERRSVLTSALAVAELLTAAGVPVQGLEVPAGPRFQSCYEGPSPGPGQLACCGRREGFAAREPEAAQQVGVWNARLLGDGNYICADQGCADWLRGCGAQVRGPEDGLEEL